MVFLLTYRADRSGQWEYQRGEAAMLDSSSEAAHAARSVVDSPLLKPDEMHQS